MQICKNKVQPLRFGWGNAKLSPAVGIFDLPAGYSCPFAKACHSRADRTTGKITDGKHTEFRCYAASMEARISTVRDKRWFNFEQLKLAKTKQGMAELILASLLPMARFVRIHSSGDFFNQAYFDAWVEVARRRPKTRFYAYTKALPFWIKRKATVPKNLVLTASYGGTHDRLIEEHGLRYAKVVYSEKEAKTLGLQIDHDDSHAMKNGRSFALLIHGTQPINSAAGEALKTLHRNGVFGYGKSSQHRIALPVLT